MWRLVALLLILLVAAPVQADDWADARKAFRRALRDEDWRHRRDAYLELVDFEGAASVQEILKAMGREKHPAVVQAGAEMLGAMISKDAVAALEEGLRRSKGEHRLYLLYAMALRTDDAGLDLLDEMAEGKDVRSAAQALLALGQRRARSRLPLLRHALERPDPRVRAAAARGIRLAVGPPPQAGSKDPWLPDGVDPDGYVPSLERALEAAVGPERYDVIRALERLTGEARGWDPEGYPHVFGLPIHGRRVVVVMDSSSGSRRSHPFEAKLRIAEILAVPGGTPIPNKGLRNIHRLERAHLTRLIEDLPEKNTKLEVLSVSQTTAGAFGKLVDLNASTKRRAVDFVEEAEIRDGPDHFAALATALDAGGTKTAWKSGPEVVILLTCSIPWAPGKPSAIVDQEELGRIVGLRARFRMIPIHTIGIGPQPREMLGRLADLSGGIYLDIER